MTAPAANLVTLRLFNWLDRTADSPQLADPLAGARRDRVGPTAVVSSCSKSPNNDGVGGRIPKVK